jgi:hypothetical protein
MMYYSKIGKYFLANGQNDKFAIFINIRNNVVIGSGY